MHPIRGGKKFLDLRALLFNCIANQFQAIYSDCKFPASTLFTAPRSALVIVLSSLPNKLFGFLVCCVALTFTNNSAQAGLIKGLPDFSVVVSSGSFDKSTGDFDVSAWVTSFTDKDGSVEDFTGTGTKFSLSADFVDGNLVGGDFSIKNWPGTVTYLEGTLWQSSTDAFGGLDGGGAARNGGVLDFVGNVTGGTYSADYQGQALLLFSSLRTEVAGRNFLSDFFTLVPNTGAADIARPVPEPATISYLVLALVFGCRRRKGH